jgi:hypothetical protein
MVIHVMPGYTQAGQTGTHLKGQNQGSDYREMGNALSRVGKASRDRLKGTVARE